MRPSRRPAPGAMDVQVERHRVEGAPVSCDACGGRMVPGATALRLTGLPAVLRSTVGAYRFDRIECARARVRQDYHDLVGLRSTNQSGWNAHAATNQERLLTLRSLVERLERSA